MTHTARERGESGYYHVVIKGDGGQIIFEDNRDRTCFLKLLALALEAFAVEVHAYCLMDNHVHLLVKDSDGELSAFMKQLNENYAQCFARKTGRVGHVFQGRFWSEPIETESHFLATLRYIHANPEPARICPHEEYIWSSYQTYLGNNRNAVPICTELALTLLGGIQGFVHFGKSGNTLAKPFPGSRLGCHLSSDEQAEVALALLGRDVISNLKAMSPAMRLPHLKALAKAGFTDTEIARITGLGQASVFRALKS